MVGEMWPRIEPFVLEACETSKGRFTADDIKQWAQDGIWQLWVAIEGNDILCVTGTEIIVYKTGLKTIAIRLCDGVEREKWQHFMANILEWGKQQGCTRKEGVFRPGWRRVLKGWDHTHEFLEGPL